MYDTRLTVSSGRALRALERCGCADTHVLGAIYMMKRQAAATAAAGIEALDRCGCDAMRAV
jgi:hypothetical protein